MKKKLLIFGGVTVGVFLLLVAGQRLFWTSSVIIEKPHRGPAVEAVYATGTVEPTVSVPIAPRTVSRLMSLNVDEGQTVMKGDVLAQLEDTDLQSSVTELTSKLAFAKSDFDRKEKLLKSRSVSQDAYDQAKANLESAQAQLDKASAQANYMKLIAPADGLIIKRDGEIGEIISAGQPVLYLSCCAPLRITAEVDEEDISAIKIGQDVLIQADAFPDKTFDGKISAITPMGDSVARSYRVRMAFKGQDVPFMIGMTVETNIILAKHEDALLIPTNCIGPKKKIQIVKKGKIDIVQPQLGIEGIDSTEVLSGITESDTLACPYNPDLKSGDAVKTERPEPDA